jgi:hypothetical protein
MRRVCPWEWRPGSRAVEPLYGAAVLCRAWSVRAYQAKRISLEDFCKLIASSNELSYLSNAFSRVPC